MLSSDNPVRSLVFDGCAAPDGNATESPEAGTPIGLQLFGFDHSASLAPVQEDVCDAFAPAATKSTSTAADANRVRATKNFFTLQEENTPRVSRADKAIDCSSDVIIPSYLFAAAQRNGRCELHDIRARSAADQTTRSLGARIAQTKATMRPAPASERRADHGHTPHDACVMPQLTPRDG